MVSGLGWADGHAPESIAGEKKSIGLWKAEDCRKLSAGSGLLLAVSQGLLEESRVLNENGKKREAEKKIQAALDFSQLATNLATNYRAYCKP
jgi:hypothetical protein|tara:strand:- start:3896 stop:4171 length:276 start_codon:yes stop_codon:yes gene_type:complete